MPKRKIDIWDVLFWIAMAVLILYIILKLLGIINTPEWINLLPFISLAFAIGVFYQKLIIFMDRMNVRTNYFKKGIDKVSEDVQYMGEKMITIDSSLLKHEERLTKLEKIKR